ncbi:MAG: creatininase family protein [Defluviitaleaceae bacterium]|nr:creatininase family protein [Defluviitaleaceae bacterium]MCL2273964.1 creatininase family protein [Defluviitaleaceae bacterium]
MLWEQLTTQQFELAAKNGVCVIPIGVLEKHGNHLPLGTDMYTSTAICKAAAEIEPAIVFPYYFFGQIAEARHYPGTIAVSHEMMMETLLAMCDEIARNGIQKIMILSGHGGNNHFLPFFAQEMPRLNRNYAVYTGQAVELTSVQRKEVQQTAGVQDLGQHAGLAETALMMYLQPKLIKNEAQDPAEGVDRQRLADIKKENLFTGYNWYAGFPNHYAGDHTAATPELGKKVFEMVVENAVKKIKAVKADDESLSLISEFAEFTKAPRTMR